MDIDPEHGDEDPAIEALQLAETARQAAYLLKSKHPDVQFTSGRRDKAAQARAMASNVVLNRRWIAETYRDNVASRACQQWVDDHPDAGTRDDIQAGLTDVLNELGDDEVALLSKHLSGEAFDVLPVEEGAAEILDDLRALPGLKKFLEREGGLVRWHAQF